MTDIVSALSLVVSIVAMLVGWKAHREANATQRRIVEIEEQRERERRLSASQASLYPRLSRTERGERLYVVNSARPRPAMFELN